MGLFNKKSKSSTNENVKPTFVIITGCAGSGKTSLGEAIAKNKHWTYIDKDTVTRDFTDYILMDKGKAKSDRESPIYCNDIRPIEYKLTFKVCQENLRLGNSVILTIPFVAQIRDYQKWIEMIEEYGLDLDGVSVKFVWINHDEGGEYTRVTKRAAERDGYKLEHWDEYLAGLEGIAPDNRYEAYRFDNDSASADELYIEDVLEWISK